MQSKELRKVQSNPKSTETAEFDAKSKQELFILKMHFGAGDYDHGMPPPVDLKLPGVRLD